MRMLRETGPAFAAMPSTTSSWTNRSFGVSGGVAPTRRPMIRILTRFRPGAWRRSNQKLAVSAYGGSASAEPAGDGRLPEPAGGPAGDRFSVCPDESAVPSFPGFVSSSARPVMADSGRSPSASRRSTHHPVRCRLGDGNRLSLWSLAFRRWGLRTPLTRRRAHTALARILWAVVESVAMASCGGQPAGARVSAPSSATPPLAVSFPATSSDGRMSVTVTRVIWTYQPSPAPSAGGATVLLVSMGVTAGSDSVALDATSFSLQPSSGSPLPVDLIDGGEACEGGPQSVTLAPGQSTGSFGACFAVDSGGPFTLVVSSTTAGTVRMALGSAPP